MNYSITFPADYKNITPLRELGFHLAKLEGFERQQCEHVRTIIDELCSNAIEYGSQPTSEVLLEVHTEEKTIRIICQDKGHGNTMSAEELRKSFAEDVDISDKRGRGLRMIVKSFSDELKVEDSKGGGIRITVLIKKKT